MAAGKGDDRRDTRGGRGPILCQITATVDIADSHGARIARSLGLAVEVHGDGAEDVAGGVIAAEDILDGATMDIDQRVASGTGATHHRIDVGQRLAIGADAIAAAIDIADMVATINLNIGGCHTGSLAAAIDIANADVAAGGAVDFDNGSAAVGGQVTTTIDSADSMTGRGMVVGTIDVDIDGALRSSEEVVAAEDTVCHLAATDVNLHGTEDTGRDVVGAVAEATTIEVAIDGAII